MGYKMKYQWKLRSESFWDSYNLKSYFVHSIYCRPKWLSFLGKLDIFWTYKDTDTNVENLYKKIHRVENEQKRTILANTNEDVEQWLKANLQ